MIPPRAWPFVAVALAALLGAAVAWSTRPRPLRVVAAGGGCRCEVTP